MPFGDSPLNVHFDAYVPLMSLPGIFGTSLASVPAKVPYLFADPALAANWVNEPGSSTAFKIGISWKGNPKNRMERRRSFPLAWFIPLARLEGVQLFSLQKALPEARRIAHFPDQLKIIDLSSRTGR